MHGWTFDEIDRMSIAQVLHALMPAKDAGQERTFDNVDAGEAFIRRNEEQKRRFVDEQMQWR